MNKVFILFFNFTTESELLFFFFVELHELNSIDRMLKTFIFVSNSQLCLPSQGINTKIVTTLYINIELMKTNNDFLFIPYHGMERDFHKNSVKIHIVIKYIFDLNGRHFTH